MADLKALTGLGGFLEGLNKAIDHKEKVALQERRLQLEEKRFQVLANQGESRAELAQAKLDATLAKTEAQGEKIRADIERAKALGISTREQIKREKESVFLRGTKIKGELETKLRDAQRELKRANQQLEFDPENEGFLRRQKDAEDAIKRIEDEIKGVGEIQTSAVGVTPEPDEVIEEVAGLRLNKRQLKENFNIDALPSRRSQQFDLSLATVAGIKSQQEYQDFLAQGPPPGMSPQEKKLMAKALKQKALSLSNLGSIAGF